MLHGAATAQSADDHTAHHPADSAGVPAAAPSTMAPAPNGDSMGGTSAGGMMDDMMAGCRGDDCGRDRRINRLLYPQLMALPDLPPEKRASVAQLGHQRMHDGIERLASLSSAAQGALQRDDYAGVQEVTERLRGALGDLDSGLAATRALSEGHAPRAVALAWYRRQMNLADPGVMPATHGLFALSGFHVVAMALLAAFVSLSAWAYVARLRRTNVILATLQARAPMTDGPAGQRPAAAAPKLRTAVFTTGSWAGRLRVARIFDETPTVKTFRMVPAEGVAELPFAFEPGQFLTVSTPAAPGSVKRSYSIASSPCCHGWCDLTIKHEDGGIVSGYFHEQVREGVLIEASGPYGRFTFRGTEADSVVFLGGGVGITPLMSSIRYLTDQSWGGRIDLVYACKNLEAVIFRDELAQLSRRHPNLHVTLVLSAEAAATWTGPRGFISADLLEQVPGIRSRRIHLCGPPAMMEAVRGVLAQMGIDPAAVHSELFLSPPRPAAPGAYASTAEAAGAVTCSFQRSGKQVPLAAGQTVLEAAEDASIAIEYACRQGYCGLCKVKLLSGEVSMEVEDGLTPLDRSSGMILACQAKASADVAVDA